jgi:drug/metabolite transporter (DMT)-like permease
MAKRLTKIPLIPGSAWIWIAIFISAASNSIVSKLHTLGSCHLAPDGKNPISFCNIFFTGSVVAFFTLFLTHPKEARPANLRGYSSKEWFLTIVSAALAGAIAPIMFFKALAETSVTNVVLVQTIEIPMVLALAWLIRGERSSRIAITGAMIALVGVTLTALIGHMGPLKLMRGDIFTIVGTFSGVLATQLSRDVLQRMSPILYGIIRNSLGSILFAMIVLKVYGPAHFGEVFTPYLWEWTLVYGSIVVVGGQLTWLRGVRDAKASDIALAVAFGPVAGVLFAYLILGEKPTLGQYIGGAVILLGVALHLIGERSPKMETPEPVSGSAFRGV